MCIRDCTGTASSSDSITITYRCFQVIDFLRMLIFLSVLTALCCSRWRTGSAYCRADSAAPEYPGCLIPGNGSSCFRLRNDETNQTATSLYPLRWTLSFCSLSRSLSISLALTLSKFCRSCYDNHLDEVGLTRFDRSMCLVKHYNIGCTKCMLDGSFIKHLIDKLFESLTSSYHFKMPRSSQ